MNNTKILTQLIDLIKYSYGVLNEYEVNDSSYKLYVSKLKSNPNVYYFVMETCK